MHIQQRENHRQTEVARGQERYTTANFLLIAAEDAYLLNRVECGEEPSDWCHKLYNGQFPAKQYVVDHLNESLGKIFERHEYKLVEERLEVFSFDLHLRLSRLRLLEIEDPQEDLRHAVRTGSRVQA